MNQKVEDHLSLSDAAFQIKNNNNKTLPEVKKKVATCLNLTIHLHFLQSSGRYVLPVPAGCQDVSPTTHCVLDAVHGRQEGRAEVTTHLSFTRAILPYSFIPWLLPSI